MDLWFSPCPRMINPLFIPMLCPYHDPMILMGSHSMGRDTRSCFAIGHDANLTTQWTRLEVEALRPWRGLNIYVRMIHTVWLYYIIFMIISVTFSIYIYYFYYILFFYYFYLVILLLFFTIVCTVIICNFVSLYIQYTRYHRKSQCFTYPNQKGHRSLASFSYRILEVQWRMPQFWQGILRTLKKHKRKMLEMRLFFEKRIV